MTLQEGEWSGYTYLWKDDQSDALLVGAEGARPIDRQIYVVLNWFEELKARVPVP